MTKYLRRLIWDLWHNETDVRKCRLLADLDSLLLCGRLWTEPQSAWHYANS